MIDRYPDGTPQECAAFIVTQLCEALCKASGDDPYAKAQQILETRHRNGAIDSEMLEMTLAVLRMHAEMASACRVLGLSTPVETLVLLRSRAELASAIRKHPTLIRAAEAADPTLIRAAEAAGWDVEALIAHEIETAMWRAL